MIALLGCSRQKNVTESKNDLIDNPQTYELIAEDVSTDCEMYAFFFDKGNYLFSISLSGTCKELNNKDLIKKYSSFLEKHKRKLKIIKGLIKVVFDGTLIYQDSIINPIMEITKKQLECEVVLYEKSEDDFLLKILD